MPIPNVVRQMFSGGKIPFAQATVIAGGFEGVSMAPAYQGGNPVGCSPGPGIVRWGERARY